MTASSGGGGSTKKVDMAAELKKPATITVWAWTPGTEEAVKMFEKAYPNIKVKLQNVGQGPPHYRKVRTVLKSGKGLPDVIHMEFQYIPSFTLTKSLLDMTPYLPDNFMSNYPEWIQKQIQVDKGIYGVPWDTGPLGFIYREDLLKKAGIKTPIKTWDEFADAAIKYHKANPKSYLVNMPGGQTGQWLGLFWQNGARPFTTDPENFKADLTDPEDQAGHRVLGQALRGRRDLARRRLHGRLVPGLREGQVRGLAVRGLGADLPPGLHEELEGQVARPGAPAVGGGPERLRQLGRLDPRGPEGEQEQGRGASSSRAGSSPRRSRSRCSRSSGSCSRRRTSCSRTRSGWTRSTRSTAASRSTRPTPTWPTPSTRAGSGIRSTSTSRPTGDAIKGKSVDQGKGATAALQPWKDAVDKYAKQQGLTVE